MATKTRSTYEWILARARKYRPTIVKRGGDGIGGDNGINLFQREELFQAVAVHGPPKAFTVDTQQPGRFGTFAAGNRQGTLDMPSDSLP